MFDLINVTFRAFKASKSLSYIYKKSNPISYHVTAYSYIYKKSNSIPYHVTTYSIASPSFKQQKEPLGGTTDADESDQLTDQKPILALPEHSEEVIKESEKDDAKKRGSDYNYKLRNLGPVVINEDGSAGIINNWHEMTDLQRENVRKIVLTRNRKRLEALKKKEKD
ncbi:hypothetical protein RclHR1_00970016 [Rhizophagus clarus]|uniref:Uncharacterized protein n=1 Tax=Rhizophagus clarus TaxID=94130 RepID=A0A2Z6SF77_9GLOM|nr:hypothetical protein RclHR1_00970016 [Rhizophagus clarus]GES96683.1 hypothetical protein GLOIN_2v1705835 [Rhizophagus clarus]